MFRISPARSAALARLAPFALMAVALIVAACKSGSGSGY